MTILRRISSQVAKRAGPAPAPARDAAPSLPSHCHRPGARRRDGAGGARPDLCHSEHCGRSTRCCHSMREIRKPLGRHKARLKIMIIIVIKKKYIHIFFLKEWKMNGWQTERLSSQGLQAAVLAGAGPSDPDPKEPATALPVWCRFGLSAQQLRPNKARL